MPSVALLEDATVAMSVHTSSQITSLAPTEAAGQAPPPPMLGDLDDLNHLEETFYRTGYDAGFEHGKLHGTFEGRELGRQKGFDVWEEVGYYEGMAEFWLAIAESGRQSRASQRHLRHIGALQTLIARFPTANDSSVLDSTPAHKAGENDETMAVDSSAVPNGDVRDHKDDEDAMMEDGEGADGSSEGDKQGDISTQLERIRARYRLLCSSLGVRPRSTVPEDVGLDGALALPEDGSLVNDNTGSGDRVVGRRTATGRGGEETVQGGRDRRVLIGGTMVDTRKLAY